ncbi:DUF4003 family protein [Nannocystis radixulma]|uniref:DUF4003 family protein n=1 Tax=Nannocystis radixulma TaxID=2995305 RepID=A0ABT5BPU8_9BACT|nr:DUF4003 family protein [Nannocystis radixulma]MDC0674961.1 DUF4003 family protein [Nannocystis radixulma]
MSFRDQHSEPGPAVDPFDRFQTLFAALQARGGDPDSLRLVAINLLGMPGEPDDIVERVRACDRELAPRFGWWSCTASDTRHVLASQLVKAGDRADAFVAEVDRVGGLFRAVGVRRGGVYETLAVLVLRRTLGGAPALRPHVERFAAIYAEMKRHHWWLTGPEDFPACAMLVGVAGDPVAIGAGIEAIYRALHERAALRPGDALQTAANILYLSGLDALEIAERFALIVRQFRAAGAKIGQQEYDDLAILCFLALPVERLVATVIAIRDRLTASRWWSRRGNLGLATNLAFVHLVGEDGALGPLADAKLLLDIQALVAARQSG